MTSAAKFNNNKYGIKFKMETTPVSGLSIFTFCGVALSATDPSQASVLSFAASTSGFFDLSLPINRTSCLSQWNNL